MAASGPVTQASTSAHSSYSHRSLDLSSLGMAILGENHLRYGGAVDQNSPTQSPGREAACSAAAITAESPVRSLSNDL